MTKISIYISGLVLILFFGLIPISFSETDVTPGFYEISQYAIGTVGIQIIFVESDGSVDSNKYNWTEDTMKQTEEGIKKGLHFWSEKYPFKDGNLEFVFRDSVLGKTGIESSTRLDIGWFAYENYKSMVLDTLSDVNCGDVNDPLSYQDFKAEHDLKTYGDEFLIQVFSCANQVREDLGTDWATVIFVPYTDSHTNGLAFGFTDGAFIIDRYSVMGGSVGIIPAHEWAHMVGSTDMIDCDLFGSNDESCGEKGGYLWVDETDTIPMNNCLMGNTGNHNKTLDTICVSNGTKNQIGWVDENNNNIPDLLENNVTIEISKIQESNSMIVIDGIVKLEPIKCKRQMITVHSSFPWKCKDTTINKISQMTSIPISKIKAIDGKFDSAFEHFTIELNPLSMNTNQLQLQTIDEITNTIQITNIQFEIESIQSIVHIIPQWIKNNAEWWADDIIDDETFVTGIEYLINQNTIHVSSNIIKSTSGEIPSWIKNNAKWWSEGAISDHDFISGIEYLVNNGIIQIN